MNLTEFLDPFADKPHLFLDMDGVQANFDKAWAKFENKEHRDHIPDPNETIWNLSNMGPEFVEKFFADLEPLADGTKLVQWLRYRKIPFTILSAPLRGQGPGSIKGKITWLNIHNPGTSATALFRGDKFVHAMDGGKPNVLVDDYVKQLRNWTNAGGIAVQHIDGQVDTTIAKLSEIYFSR